MDTVTYPDPCVAHFLAQHFVPVKIPIKENPQLAEEYLVTWTPHVVVADEKGHVHYRVEGYFPPEEFLAQLSLGIGKYRLERKQFDRAAERFEEVAARHAGSDAGAEALYWLGVARYKAARDISQLRPHWDQLARQYPGSEWTRRTKIPS
jgi:tetratricopeptide (TPR) repeat protein